MANICFILDPDPGHIYPILGIAENLQKKGNKICILGVIDIKSLVLEYGLPFIPIFEEEYPVGFLKAYKNMQKTHSEMFF